MEKRGQSTNFMILGITTLMFFLIGFYLYFNAVKEKSETASTVVQKGIFESSPVELYTETCLKQVSENALFGRIGFQGGYISTNGADLTTYYDRGASEFYKGSGDFSLDYQEFEVPFYLDGSIESYLPKEEIEKKMARYVIVNFIDCLNFTVFKDLGFIVTEQEINDLLPILKNDFKDSIVSSKVTIGPNFVNVKVTYPIEIKKGNFKKNINDFSVSLPIRLGAAYENSIKLIEKLKEAHPNQYNVENDCNLYDTNGLTNVYIRDNSIVQFVDFESYKRNYIKAFVFQFAVKNVNITGACVG